MITKDNLILIKRMLQILEDIMTCIELEGKKSEFVKKQNYEKALECRSKQKELYKNIPDFKDVRKIIGIIKKYSA